MREYAFSAWMNTWDCVDRACHRCGGWKEFTPTDVDDFTNFITRERYGFTTDGVGAKEEWCYTVTDRDKFIHWVLPATLTPPDYNV